MSLSREDLWSLEQYAEERENFRRQIIEHKKNRQVFLGPHATLYFEDALTMKYQVQEMLRIEKIFTAKEIEEELDAYNPLIPDGNNWKATFMIEYPDAEERRIALAKMTGIEHKVWVSAGDAPRVYGKANEDLERSNDDKTAAVHFMRFEFDTNTVSALQGGVPIRIGIDHPELPYDVLIAESVRQSLIQDLN
ncbi:MAG: DUF3501 family protein [Pseudomonadales bacterium]|nr:DUF3501 family protein [Pseudomonadales bacterium]